MPRGVCLDISALCSGIQSTFQNSWEYCYLGPVYFRNIWGQYFYFLSHVPPPFNRLPGKQEEEGRKVCLLAQRRWLPSLGKAAGSQHESSTGPGRAMGLAGSFSFPPSLVGTGPFSRALSSSQSAPLQVGWLGASCSGARRIKFLGSMCLKLGTLFSGQEALSLPQFWHHLVEKQLHLFSLTPSPPGNNGTHKVPESQKKTKSIAQNCIRGPEYHQIPVFVLFLKCEHEKISFFEVHIPKCHLLLAP